MRLLAIIQKCSYFCPLLSTECVSENWKAMLFASSALINSITFVFLVVCPYLATMFVCYTTTSIPLWKRICVIIIVKNYSFSLHNSNITEFYIYTIFMIPIFSHNDHRSAFRSHKHTHTLLLTQTPSWVPASFSLQTTKHCSRSHKDINYKSVSFSRGNVIKSRWNGALWKQKWKRRKNGRTPFSLPSLPAPLRHLHRCCSGFAFVE